MKGFALLLTIFVIISGATKAQSYRQEIAAWQQRYKAEFLEDARSPLKAKDTAYLRFYPVQPAWAVPVEILITPDAKPIDIATHAGITKKFRAFAKLVITNPEIGAPHYDTLTAYESLRGPGPDSLVFIPFNDATNGDETYGGGRYMDVPKRVLQQPGFRLDFNKAYNPWCVFASGYSCPIPPAGNHLEWAIRAGEKLPEERIRARE